MFEAKTISCFSDSLNPIQSGGIYAIINRSNGKIYIGSGVNVRRRFHRHKSDLLLGRHFNKHLQSAFNKNPDGLEFSVIEEVSNPKNLIGREQFWIGFYNSSNRNLGYNKSPTAGSNLGATYPLGHGLKISKANKGRKYLVPYSQERIRNMSIGNMGKPSFWKGKKIPIESRIKMSETRKNLFRNGLIKINWRTIPVVQLDFKGKEIGSFKSIKEASEVFGGNLRSTQTMIVRSCKSKLNSAKGYFWKYA